MKKLLTTTALMLSLAFSGMAYAHDDSHGKDGHDGRPPFMDVLPKDKAAQFHDIMKQAHDKNMELVDQMHKLREERRAILTAPEFDKDAYLTKSEELTKFRESMHKEMKANMKEAFATALGNLSQKERQAVAASMEKMHHGHHRHGHHHWGHEHDDGHHMHDKSDKHANNKSSSDSSQ